MGADNDGLGSFPSVKILPPRGHRAASGTKLQGVIADLARGIHRFLEISRLDSARTRFGGPRPDPRKAIGLQLDPRGNAVAFLDADLLTVPMRLGRSDADAGDPGGGGCMIGPGTGVRVYLACGATDMRKGIEGFPMIWYL